MLNQISRKTSIVKFYIKMLPLRRNVKIVLLGFILICIYSIAFCIFGGYLLLKSETKDWILELDKLDVFSENHLKFTVSTHSNISCPYSPKQMPKSSIQMLKAYKKLKFNDKWDQEWNIKINYSRWNPINKLKVFIVPHSHNDPGWLATVNAYFYSRTRHILSNILRKLLENPLRKFIWAEISYFSMWWNTLTLKEKEDVKKLIKNGQLEFVTGGWVMNDEANSHWISIVHQLTEGHQWLHKNLQYTPRSHWAIDPFGLSPTQSFLLQRSGFQNMLIQRVHYSIKQELARQQNLEFNWKQLWDSAIETGIFTQMMPFHGYSIKYTCGPDPKVCYQFDFKYLSKPKLWNIEWLWKPPPQEITDSNLEERALLLLDQYRKKSMLFKTNVLLVPLGDDFRYDNKQECDAQFRNYEKLINYLNSNSDLHVEITFGTLSDYFDAVRQEKDVQNFPTLTGDFFTYADKNKHYWSGYYTSRPFYKRTERALLSYLRSAEIISSLVYLQSKSNVESSLKIISKARKCLALFQHHDGITGTARKHVMVDYGTKMVSNIKALQSIIQSSVKLLLLNKCSIQDSIVDDIWVNYSTISKNHIISFSSHKSVKVITIFNSLLITRNETVSLVVSTPYVEVSNLRGEKILCQISPIFENSFEPKISDSKYELTFSVSIPPLGISFYSVHYLGNETVSQYTAIAKLKIYNHDKNIKSTLGHVETLPLTKEIIIHNSKISTYFDKLGLLKSVQIGSDKIPIYLDFAKYGTNLVWDKSGAYLFIPKGNAVPISASNIKVKVTEGPIMSSVQVQLPYVHHTVKIYDSPGADGLGLEIENLVNIGETDNFELVMRLTTNIKNNDIFFTDLNGYQLMRRIRFDKLPLQGNYYPMPSMMYIEDQSHRLTVVTSSPLGATSLNDGQIEIMQDRRLNQDDHLGLGEGVQDNVPTRHIFRVLVERRVKNCQPVVNDHPSGFSSLAAHVASQSILNPLVKIIQKDSKKNSKRCENFSPIAFDLDIDFSIPILRPDVWIDGERYLGITINRHQFDISFTTDEQLQSFCLSNGKINLQQLLSLQGNKTLLRSSLTYMYKKDMVNISEDIIVKPMEIETFLFHH